jgi:hypothetical protein
MLVAQAAAALLHLSLALALLTRAVEVVEELLPAELLLMAEAPVEHPVLVQQAQQIEAAAVGVALHWLVAQVDLVLLLSLMQAHNAAPAAQLQPLADIRFIPLLAAAHT